MGRDQLRKQSEHVHNFRPGYLRQLRINGAKRSEERSILQKDGHRNIALATVGRKRVMSAINRILRDIVDDHRFVAFPDLVADGGFDLQLTVEHSPTAISSRTAQQIHRSSVTRATAANPIPA